MSDDRIEIATATVRALLEEQVPALAWLELRPVDRPGWDNRTFRLGPGHKVRLPSAARYAAQPAKEHAVLPALAPCLPVRIPRAVALGRPSARFPHPWSVQDWIDGEALQPGTQDKALALDLARFLAALWRAPSAGGPPPGDHCFHRGGALRIYDDETRACLRRGVGGIDAQAALALWQAALDAHHDIAPVWVHGDVAAGNLLLDGGRLSAVIDWGSCAVGDPACDLVASWTMFEGEARQAFRQSVGLDAGTWARARGWALWKALLQLEAGEALAESVVHAVLAEHAQASRS